MIQWLIRVSVTFTDMEKLCQQRPSLTRTPINAKVSEKNNWLYSSCLSVALQSYPIQNFTNSDFSVGNINWELMTLGSIQSGQSVRAEERFCAFLHHQLINAQWFSQLAEKGFQQTVGHQFKTKDLCEPPTTSMCSPLVCCYAVRRCVFTPCTISQYWLPYWPRHSLTYLNDVLLEYLDFVLLLHEDNFRIAH